MTEYLILDCETTTFQKGNPYSQQNKLCLVGIRTPNNEEYILDIEYTDHNYKGELDQLQRLVSQTKTLVLFNAKFDLAWLDRYSCDFTHCRIFDCQLAHFIMGGQKDPFPSLNQVSQNYEIGTKLDEVKELWKKGIDTPQIPVELLSEYLSMDLSLTKKVYLRQIEQLESCSQAMKMLVSLGNQDLLVLLEMEKNGLKLDFDGLKQESNLVEERINILEEKLNYAISEYGLPDSVINWNSNDFVSSVLYGGTIKEVYRVVVGYYKSGPKMGNDRYSLNSREYVLPRRVTPIDKTALKKEGFFATNEETLRTIKEGASIENKELINNLLTLSKLEKLNGTYYKGLEKLTLEKDWEPGYIHGQYNQVVAQTGRLSSSNPNLQNFPPEVDKYVRSRYE